jgi:RHS repeat-associated protein
LHEQFGYAYDGAWNLNYRTNNALIETFGVNNLNELTSVARDGTLTVAGVTTSQASDVSVNGQMADVYGDNAFARAGFVLADGTNFTAIAHNAAGRADTNSVTLDLPATVSLNYDQNGNLLSDGKRGFEYDNENQLVSVIVTNGSGSSTWSQFIYDGLGRRRVRVECSGSESAWVTNAIVWYVYDGPVVVQERNGANVPLVTYSRGPDLSGSPVGAGGIGGLLARTDNRLPASYPNAHAYYHADGNGNITCLVNTSNVVVAGYAYDPFGAILVMSGPLAQANLYRFSSKEYHANSGLTYYLYRYYDPGLQRWSNRDPIGEDGGMNLYAALGNAPIGEIDAYGLDICVQNTPSVGGWHRRVAVGAPDKAESLYGQSFGMADRRAKMQGFSASSGGGPAPGKAGSGIVYQDDAPAIKTPRRFKTTPEEDAWAKDQLQKELNNTGPYHWLTSNCRGYSSDNYNELVRAIRRQRGEKPPVLRAPKDAGNYY